MIVGISEHLTPSTRHPVEGRRRRADRRRHVSSPPRGHRDLPWCSASATTLPGHDDPPVARTCCARPFRSTPRAASAGPPEPVSIHPDEHPQPAPPQGPPRRRATMNDFNRRKFLKNFGWRRRRGDAGAGAALLANAGVRRRHSCSLREGRCCACCAGAASCQGDIDATWSTSRSSPRRPAEVRVDNEGWEDVRPKAAVAVTPAPGGHHPCRPTTMRTCIRTSCSTAIDVAEYIGKKYGPWYAAGEAFLKARRQEVDRRPAWPPVR